MLHFDISRLRLVEIVPSPRYSLVTMEPLYYIPRFVISLRSIGLVVAVASLVGVVTTARIFASSLSDLVEDELGDGVGEGRGDWEEVGFGLVTVGISNVCQFEILSVGEGEGNAALHLYGAVGA